MVTVSKTDTAESLKDGTALINEIESADFIGTYVPTTDRYKGAAIYKKKVTDEDQPGPRWLYKDMKRSISISNVSLSLSMTDGKKELLQKLLAMADGNHGNGAPGTWVIDYDKPKGLVPLAFSGMSEANCPVNQTIDQFLRDRKTKIPHKYLSIKCT